MARCEPFGGGTEAAAARCNRFGSGERLVERLRLAAAANATAGRAEPPSVVPAIFTDLRKVYDGPVVQTQDLTVFNVTQAAVVARQAQVELQPQAVPGQPRVAFTPTALVDPAWFKEARIPIDDVLALP